MFTDLLKKTHSRRLTDVACIGLMLMVVILAGSVNLYAQVNAGIIVGTVTDPNGAVAPNAEVTATHLELSR